MILFDAADRDCLIGLNLLSVPKGVEPNTVAKQALEVVKKIFADDWSATRMQRAMFAALRVLVEKPGSTLMDIALLFADPEFRAEVLSRVNDPIMQRFWLLEYEKLSQP